jgi:hypothetical protein
MLAPRLAAAAATAFLQQRVGKAVRQVHRADGPAPVRAALQPGREPDHDVQVPVDHATYVRAAHLDRHPVPRGKRRRVDLRDRGRCDRLLVKAREHLIQVGAQLGAEHAGDLRPGHLGGIILQMTQLADELGRDQVPAGGYHLAQLDERDPAVLQGQPERPGQPGPPFGGGKLRTAPAAQVGQQSAADQDPADLRVAAGAAQLPAQAAQHVQRAGQRSARHQRLGDDQENHAHQQRDNHAEEHEQQAGKGGPRPADR